MKARPLSIGEMAAALEASDRQGAMIDTPEGACFVTLSDTVTRRFSDSLWWHVGYARSRWRDGFVKGIMIGGAAGLLGFFLGELIR